jgi:hypothetical protein
VIGGLPGHTGTEYQPTTATVTIEVEVDAAAEHGRYRHRPRVHRVRSELR